MHTSVAQYLYRYKLPETDFVPPFEITNYCVVFFANVEWFFLFVRRICQQDHERVIGAEVILYILVGEGVLWPVRV
jgi:hypothetical protein